MRFHQRISVIHGHLIDSALSALHAASRFAIGGPSRLVAKELIMTGLPFRYCGSCEPIALLVSTWQPLRHLSRRTLCIIATSTMSKIVVSNRAHKLIIVAGSPRRSGVPRGSKKVEGMKSTLILKKSRERICLQCIPLCKTNVSGLRASQDFANIAQGSPTMHSE